MTRVLLLCGLCGLVETACHRDPSVAFARLQERAASWSASVQFAGELSRQRRVPATYVHDVLSTASRELDALRQQVLELKDIDTRDRADAADACSRLAAIIGNADRSRTMPDEGELREIEIRLRESAQRARALAPAESRR
jgi:hypothetical protein